MPAESQTTKQETKAQDRLTQKDKVTRETHRRSTQTLNTATAAAVAKAVESRAAAAAAAGLPVNLQQPQPPAPRFFAPTFLCRYEEEG